MENINRNMLRTLTQEQQILYMAMMMDPNKIPMFNQKEQEDYIETGKTIKKMINDKVFTKMYMKEDGYVVLE